jgi:hypothetical protein
MTYDRRSEELARYFLGEEADPHHIASMASYIQCAVEEWFEMHPDIRGTA